MNEQKIAIQNFQTNLPPIYSHGNAYLSEQLPWGAAGDSHLARFALPSLPITPVKVLGLMSPIQPEARVTTCTVYTKLLTLRPRKKCCVCCFQQSEIKI